MVRQIMSQGTQSMADNSVNQIKDTYKRGLHKPLHIVIRT